MKQSKINIDFSKPQVMAILNVTPDSFFSGSRTFSVAEIEERVVKIAAQGATIIDIGGYSSRPGAEEVTIEEEWSRVERGLEVVRRLAPDLTVSIDTFRSEVAQRAISKFGALIINDISAGELDPKLMEVAAKYKVPYIAMHMRGTPQTMQSRTSYNDVTEEVATYFELKIKELKRVGVENIIIDPGFGFAKSVEQNYSLLANLGKLKMFNLPILVGVSRKSMIYKVLNSAPEEALTGTIALNWEALRQGATIIRVHDIQEAVETITIFNKFSGQ
ncbi:MAG: dihydropteroate synthase [Rikenellaceae bacterium]